MTSLLILLVGPALAASREAAVLEAPQAHAIVEPDRIPPLAVPLTAPRIDGFLALPSPQMAPSADGTAPLAPAAVEPETARSFSPFAPRASDETLPSADPSSPEQPSAGEADWLSGAALFDQALGPGGSALEDSAGRKPRTDAEEKYVHAVREAGREGWTGHGAKVSDAAHVLLDSWGVKSSRLKVGPHEGVEIAPELGRSPLNDFAYDLKRKLGTSLDYVPERTANAVAGYNAMENRILLAGLDRPDFFLAILHESRHAWYSALLLRGQIRAFHMMIIAKPGRSVAAGAQSYVNFFSFEELSTHPKTLKHIITEAAKVSGADRKFLEAKALTYAYQYVDVLRSAALISAQLLGLDRRGMLTPRGLSDEEAAREGLPAAPGIQYFAEDLSQGALTWPVPKRETRKLGFRRVRGDKKEALAMLRARAKLFDRLAADSLEPTQEYLDAVKAEDWPAASRAADKLIRAAAQAEENWSAQP